MSAPKMTQNTQNSAHTLGGRRDLARPARLVIEGLEAEVADSVEALGVVDLTAELSEVFRVYGRRSVAMFLRPGLVPDRIIDSAVVTKFGKLTSDIELEEQEARALRADRRAVEAELALRKPAPGSAWLTALVAGVLLAALAVAAGAGSLLTVALEEFVIRRALGDVAPALSFAVSAGLAGALVAALLLTLLVSTLATWGRVSLAAKLGFFALETVFAVSFAVIRLGTDTVNTNVWAGVAWSGFELSVVALGALMLVVVGQFLKWADKRRRRDLALKARIAKLVRDEAEVDERLAVLKSDLSEVAFTIQEREEAAEELRAAIELAEATADIGVLKGIARNRHKAAGGQS